MSYHIPSHPSISPPHPLAVLCISRSIPLSFLHLLLHFPQKDQPTTLQSPYYHYTTPNKTNKQTKKKGTHQRLHRPMQRVPVVAPELGIRPLERRVAVRFGLLDSIFVGAVSIALDLNPKQPQRCQQPASGITASPDPGCTSIQENPRRYIFPHAGGRTRDYKGPDAEERTKREGRQTHCDAPSCSGCAGRSFWTLVRCK